VALFVVLLLNVDRPHVVGRTEEVVHREHCGVHRVVRIVVAVHAVAPHRKYVWHFGLQPRPNRLNVLTVRCVVHRVRLWHAHHVTLNNSSGGHQVQHVEFTFAEGNQVRIGAVPQSVAFIHEVFEPETGHPVLHHERRPRCKILDTAERYLWIVNVDPVVRERRFARDNKGHRDEVPMTEPVRCGANMRGCRWVHGTYQITDRH
jgi:hypothetical protein